jgi:alcohol dehydrogenase (cytochrome c)
MTARCRRAALWCLLVVGLHACLSACGPRIPDHPVTQTGQPFTRLNAAVTGTAPAVAQHVTFERLVRAHTEPHNWLTYYGAYGGQRYSALAQINTSNVQGLRPAWVFQQGVIGLIATPATYAFEAAPLIVDGVMFVSGWDGYVWALNAATGELLWQYKHAIPLDVPLCCGNVNRGVAVARGKVFVATANGHLVALDATNGQPVWDRAFVDVRAGESATGAPLIVKNLVIVGSSGAEYGVRGHIDAFEIDTGARAWRRYNIPKPGEPGAETWSGEAWATGGGSAWVTGSYDPELNLLYWNTGNPSPDFDGSVRPGDNLFTNAVVALTPDDGALRWHYQWTPHDVWDYDGVNENILFERDGQRLLAHFDKNGYLFILNRTTGKLVHATPFGRVTWGTIEPQTGRVTVQATPTPEGTLICPGPAGLKEWPHAAYSPDTGLLYTPVVEACGVFKLKPTKFREGMPYWGGEASVVGQEQWGHVKAVDPMTGQEAWSWRSDQPIVASVLATAGDLVFVGTPSGAFVALHARTGQRLWHFQTGSGIHSSPVTYAVNGKQFVAVPTGWGGWLKGFAPNMYGAQRGTALVVFALP